MQPNEIFSVDKDVMSGATVFAGTRVPVSALFENLADGMTLDEFIENFPTVDRAAAEAAILLAGRDFLRLVA